VLKNYSCHYLEKALTLLPTSEVRPCCRFDVSRYDIKNFTWDNKTPIEQFYTSAQFAEIRRQSKSGEPVAGCHRCYREEDLGIKSMRQKDFPGSADNSNDGPLKISMIELGVGRICNLKCRSCDPYFSTKWDADARVANKPIPEKGLDVNLDALDVQFFRNARFLKITGGEPFYHPAFEKLIYRLVNEGVSENIDIEIFSNATKLPGASFVEALKRFRSVTMTLSIDGLGDKNTYLRHPSRWSDIESAVQFWSQLKRSTPTFKLQFAVTVSILNILSLFELLDWFYNLETAEPGIIIQNVQDPTHLNVSYWPIQIRKNILAKFLQQKETFFKTHTVQQNLVKRIGNTEKMLESVIEPEDVSKAFWRETFALDKTRNESFSMVFPELYQIISSSLNKELTEFRSGI
jgi:MoaA/NifB/PqqE/SkfB family radical SAM enzyme